MEKRVICSDKAVRTVGSFSTATELNGTIYLSGITAVDPKTNILSGDVSEQAEKVLTIMKDVLEEAGSSMDNVLKCTVFLNDVNDFAAVNAVYARFFKAPYPARICVQAAKIPLGALVEIDAIAYR